jgi:hypothetical protein
LGYSRSHPKDRDKSNTTIAPEAHSLRETPHSTPFGYAA